MNLTKPVITKKHWLSGIWLLPLVAALIGGWTIYQSINEKGIEISIVFDDAEGIREGKTPIMYKGVRIGVVKKVDISANLQQVKVLAEIQRAASESLRKTTGFWLVKPKVSMTEITGLDTIVSGNYIRMNPGEGEQQREFIALDKPPIIEEHKLGLIIDIFADSLGSIARGSKIYFRQIPVGEVLDYELAEAQNGVIIKALIEARYAYLVKKSSRFWNASGLSIKAGLSGFSMQTESLAALIAGGIAFYTPDTDSVDTADSTTQFKLHGDFDSAKVGILVEISFESAIGLQEGVTEVQYDAFKIGIVKKLSYKKTGKSVIAEVMFDPRAEQLLKAGTKFWLDKPKLSLTDFSGLKSLLQGNHIKMQVGGGVSVREFIALNKPPLMSIGDKGIHLILKADSLGSIEYGSPVLYKKIQVGQVHDFKLDKKGESVLIDIYITERYAHLVAPSSRFWNASGVQVSIGTAGMDIQTGTMGTVLNGGIEFITPELSTKKIKNHALYDLYPSYAAATGAGLTPYKPAKDETIIQISTDDLGSLAIGSQVYFKKISVGKLVFYRLSEDNDSIIMSVAIRNKYRHLLTDSSQFWRNSGLKVKAGLAGVDVNMTSLSALLNGGISFANPTLENTATIKEKDNKIYHLYPDEQSALQLAEEIKIKFSLANGISAGTAIKYLGIPVGEISSVKLAEDNQVIIANAKLFGSAIQFARAGTKFWLVSAQLGLFKNKNLDTLIKGSYLDIEPGHGAKQTEFVAKLNPAEIKQGLHLVLQTPRLGSIKVGNSVAYRQMNVGEVRGFRLSSNATQVLIDIYIAPQYAPLIKNNTKFWNASGVSIDFGWIGGAEVRTESVESIVTGGIAFATPEAEDIMATHVQARQVFDLHKDYQPEWLAWRPEIALVE
ncbi:MAG: MlaD family protein [Methyloprofundus sp.]|nr:MlaD family protein [Methyloprofundus sp.]MDT8425457.1 MlaD family protein [Methyloprofundus sp.]